MTYSVQELLDNISKYRYNPAGIQREVVKMVAAVSNGELAFVDATNPVVLCLESASVMTAAFMNEHAAESRRRYARMAQTQEDLYLHMSDIDYVDRFASPARVKISFLFPKEKLISSMKLEQDTGYMKVTIPRNTYIDVAGTRFSMQYPVDIRQLSHGGLQIVYDTNQPSPLQTLETNAIENEIVTSAEGDFLLFEVEMLQFKIESQTGSVSQSHDFKMTIPVEDKYFHARVYHQNAAGGWDELRTTHADSIYDITDPTAVLTVLDGVLLVKIPQIYVSQGLLSRKVRVDVYQTKGAINMPLKEYPMNAFGITWKSYDGNDSSIYTAALSGISVRAFSNQVLIDGANGIEFETLRRNVINNTTGPIDNPISPAQIETKLTKKGYDIVTHLDNVTDRVFLATREMPSPTLVAPTTAAASSSQLLTTASASIKTMSISTKALSQMPTVVDNGSSVTILPDTIYQLVDGVTVPVQYGKVQELLSLPADKRALAVSNSDYLFTPFHYVLDMTNNAFEIRPYHLDEPEVKSKQLVRPNDTTLIQLATGNFAVSRHQNGYTIQVVTKSDDKYKALDDNKVFAQLSFVPTGERDRAYINGLLVGKMENGERVFEFDLSTTFNVDRNDQLELTKFTMYNTEPRITKTPLLTSFDILYSTSEVMSELWMPNDIDRILGRYLLPQQIAGITHETLKVKLGDSLAMLWTRARTVVGSTPYRVWEADVPAFYPEDIYETDETGSKIKIINGEVVMNVIHRAGDPILGTDGIQLFEHRKGDIMYEDGKPVPADVRSLLRHMDLFLLEGAYWFATDATSKDYRKRLTSSLVNWLVNDLGEFKGKLLDQTRIYFYPKTTTGVIKVLVGDDIPKAVQAGQSFQLVLSVSKQVFQNPNLRKRLEQVSIETLSKALQQKTVAVSQMIEALRAAYGSDVIDVKLTGLGGVLNYSVMTIASDTDRLSLRKRLVALADDSLVVQEDTSIQFVQHKQAV